MTFSSIAALTQSSALRQRLIACAASLGVEAPEAWVTAHIWDVAVAPGAGDLWKEATDAGIPDPGAVETVITDDAIRAVVQAIIAAEGAA